MNEQIKDGKIKKVKGMLFEAEKSLSLEYEKRLSSIRELALYIVALMNKKEKPFSDIKELLSRDVEEFGFHRELLPENKHLVLRGISYLHNFDKALLCESLIREWEKANNEPLLAEVLLDCAQLDSGYISYVKNKYSDRAFDELSPCVDEPRVVYAKNFFGVCEDISRGFATYGILPISTPDGDIEAVKRLLSAYELKICAITDIKAEDDTVTKYALISDKVRFVIDADSRFFAFSLASDGADSTERICEAFSLFGLNVCSVNLNSAYTGGYNSYFCIKENNENLSKLLLYLSLFYPDFVVNGFYSEI